LIRGFVETDGSLINVRLQKYQYFAKIESNTEKYLRLI